MDASSRKKKNIFDFFFFTRDSYVSCGRTVFTKVSGWNILVYSVILTKSFNVPFQMKKNSLSFFFIGSPMFLFDSKMLSSPSFVQIFT